MSKKRFKLIGDSNLEMLMQHQLELPIYDNYQNNKRLSLSNVLDLLNELDEKYVDEFSLRETLQLELQRVEEENKQLKQDKSRLVNYLKRGSSLFEDEDYLNELILDNQLLDGDVRFVYD